LKKEAKSQLAFDTLREEILSGRYLSEDAFPSVSSACRRFGLSLATVVRIFDRLKVEGLVASQQGVGTFVTRNARLRKIGLVVPDHGQSEFFPAIVREISRLSQDAGYTLVFGEIAAGGKDAARVAQLGRLVDDMIAQGVAGVIFQPIDYIGDSEAANRRVLERFDAARIPVVLCDYDYVEAPARSNHDVVGFNNLQAGAIVVRHLLDRGARNIHFHLRPFAPRSHRGLVCGAFGALVEGTRRMPADRLLTCAPDDAAAVGRYCRRHRPDAFVCGNDSTAARLKKTLASLGYDVPRDLMLTGVNDLQIASLLTPSLTTVHVACDQIASTAFRRLVARIADPALPPCEILLPIRLVARESTRRGIQKLANPKRKQNRKGKRKP